MTPAQMEHVAEHVAQLVARLIVEQKPPEAWVDKRGLAAHLACSVRSVEAAMAEGLPHAVIFGRAKFRLTDVEAWLEVQGLLRPEGGAASVARDRGVAPPAAAHPRHPTEEGLDAFEA